MAVNQSNKSWNPLQWFRRLFKRRSNSDECIADILLIFESNSRLLTRSELDLIIRHLPETYYESNSNQTIYSLKSNGKPFFVDTNQYNYDIYRHQTDVGNGMYFCDKHRDLMYVLRILFCELNTSQMTRKQLDLVLEVLPQSYYEMNLNQTIYSFKLNGKPFFIDKTHYIGDNLMKSHTSPLINTDITEETDIKLNSSKSFGKKLSEKNRLIFIQLKTREKLLKLKQNKTIARNGLNRRQSKDNSLDNRAMDRQNGQYLEPKEVILKADKWIKLLSERKVHQKSERNNSSKNENQIQNKCKESPFDGNERRKRVALKSKLKQVLNCELLRPTFYAICEVIESNDVNHNNDK